MSSDGSPLLQDLVATSLGTQDRLGWPGAFQYQVPVEIRVADAVTETYSTMLNTDPDLIEMHGFSDASEAAYAAVVYLRISDKSGNTQTSLMSSKTKVAPIKRLSIPRLELCWAQLLMHHVRNVLKIPLHHVYAWTDIINWLVLPRDLGLTSGTESLRL